MGVIKSALYTNRKLVVFSISFKAYSRLLPFTSRLIITFDISWAGAFLAISKPEPVNIINKVSALILISQMIDLTGTGHRRALIPGPVFKKSILLFWF